MWFEDDYKHLDYRLGIDGDLQQGRSKRAV
jgi:hypothetical protein